MNFISPISRKPLILNEGKTAYINLSEDESFAISENVVVFLPEVDNFYEGAYLNRIKYLPKYENLFTLFPLWLINSGFMWEVRKQFQPGSLLLELGCAAGVDYFGKRFRMIGIDLSFKSLKGLNNYLFGLQADATNIPLADQSVDGIISSYFWEHIPAGIKDKMLLEFKRVLKPGGKLVFLYDVETENTLISVLKNHDPLLYKQLFLDKDAHLGYETPGENRLRFERAGYTISKHFGMERTVFQSNSVYVKFKNLKGIMGIIGRIGNFASKFKILNFVNIFWVRVIDTSFGKFLPLRKSRIIISVVKVQS